MFGGGQRTVVLDAFHEGGNKLRYTVRIFPERSRIDDGISRIIVYIRIRCVNPLDTSGACFQRGDFSHGVRIFGIAAGGDRHRGGERCAFVVAHGRAALEIRADQQRQLGFRLQLVRKHGCRIRLALHDAQRRAVRDDDESADVQILHVAEKLFIGGRVRGSKASVIGGEQELANLFVHRHFTQR